MKAFNFFKQMFFYQSLKFFNFSIKFSVKRLLNYIFIFHFSKIILMRNFEMGNELTNTFSIFIGEVVKDIKSWFSASKKK